MQKVITKLHTTFPNKERTYFNKTCFFKKAPTNLYTARTYGRTLLHTRRSEAAVSRCFTKQVFWKILLNSLENASVEVNFSQSCRTRLTPTQVFFDEFVKFSRTPFLQNTKSGCFWKFLTKLLLLLKGCGVTFSCLVLRY